jgi:hypothetical protein
MSWPEDPADLLAGPRGRRLCFELACPVVGRNVDDPPARPGWFDAWMRSAAVSQDQLRTELDAALAVAGLDRVAAERDPLRLLAPLARSVDEAMYWQQPDGIDYELASRLLAEALVPVAHAVSAAPAAGWWASPLDAASQRITEFRPEETGDRRAGPPEPAGAPEPPGLTGAKTRLAAWRADTLADEESAADRPADPAAAWSGDWWSAPAASDLIATTRSLPGLGAVGLALVEDTRGLASAWCWLVRSQPDVRCYEIRGPADWIALTGRYPLPVSRSRRHDWWRVTGLAGDWLIPDYAAMAADYDAVHLTVGGYLTTAGRALQAGAARTMLAGWNPDETYWLADVLELAGVAAGWVNPDGEPAGWMPER